ncbi:unnamed protein product [Spirodela intermedia]|uniref:NPH3 domain-containing protein n=1 Tax=Spirodela intermedia TaxID=51605 RepID=A0A7I8ID92_SPIIN|nr:unnamed protein product [Spirodela intermedia]CAA6655768.1 unnamed protein product [Spirodela intermedia]
MQEELCDLKVYINGGHEYFLDQRILCTFSGSLSRMAKKEKRRRQIEFVELEIADFPGGADGFELAARFCYGNGRIHMSPSNISLLHCAALALEMTEEVVACNLLAQTETFLEGLFYWTWREVLDSLKSCELFIDAADDSGLLQKLFSALLGKISANSEIPLVAGTPFASSSSSSSPDTYGLRFSSSPRPPTASSPVIEKLIATLGAYASENRNLILTRFLLHYLKTAVQKASSGNGGGVEDAATYGGLADTAVYGVVLMGRTAFSCRGLFWVLRVVSGLGLSKDCRNKLERLIGSMLDQATLDDLLISGHDGGVFVSLDDGGVALQRMKKVGRLMDKYLREISPDQSLRVSKFLGIAESLPDSARDCFDGVYRALDIYLESHPALSFEERSRLCRCINYESSLWRPARNYKEGRTRRTFSVSARRRARRRVTEGRVRGGERSPPAAKDELRLNLQMMQWRVAELEKVCREMKGQMSKMAKSGSKVVSSPSHLQGRGLPRLC